MHAEGQGGKDNFYLRENALKVKCIYISDVTRLWQKQAIPVPKTTLPALKSFKMRQKLVRVQF